MFLVGLVAFTLTSAAAGLAPDAQLLVVARLLQGAAAGLLTPQNTGLIQQLFSGAERGRAFGLFGTTVGLSAATGPVLGGLIIAAFGAGRRLALRVLRQRPDRRGRDGPRAAAGCRRPSRARDGPLADRRGRRAAARGRGARRAAADRRGDGRPGHPAVVRWCCSRRSPAWASCAGSAASYGGEGAPLLDVRLFAQAPGLRVGDRARGDVLLRVRGIWLVLALYLQDGLGFTPAAVRAGRDAVRDRLGGRLGTAGRVDRPAGPPGDGVRAVLVVAGFAATAAVVPLTSPSHPAAVAGGAAVRRRGRRRRRRSRRTSP